MRKLSLNFLMVASVLSMLSSCAEYSISKKKGVNPIQPAVSPAPEINVPPELPPIPSVPPAGLTFSYTPVAPATGQNIDLTVIGCDEGALVTWRLNTTSLDSKTTKVKVKFQQPGTYKFFAQCTVAGVVTEGQVDIPVIKGSSGNCSNTGNCCCCCCTCCSSGSSWFSWNRSSGCR